MEKKQRMRFSDRELEVIKSVFAENDSVLITLRKVFLQLPLNESDEGNVRLLRSNPEVLRVIRKSFLPEIEAEAPIQQVIDLWMTIELKDKGERESMIAIEARDLLIKYLDQQLKKLESDGVESINFSDLIMNKGDVDDLVIRITARNTIISHTEIQLFQFSVLAGKKEETVEETRERLEKNSSK